MKLFRFSLLFILTINLLTACSAEYKFSLETPKKVVLGEIVQIKLTEENNNPFEKATFFVNGKEVESKDKTLTINTKDFGVGKQIISALVVYEGKSKKINNSIEIFSKNPPIIYDFKIVNTYPHDDKAYTQGLEYHDGYLYESTGRKGQSSIRKVDLKTGKILKRKDIDKKYFGEGMTIFKDKIYFLTWQSKKGFVYNLKTFEQEKEFAYNRSVEGWGLTHSETELIKSDGSDKIWFLDPTTLQEKRSIQAYTNDRSVKDLNELEFINGKIYANKWQQNAIVIINPKNGAVEGVANMKNLKKVIEEMQKLDKADDVLNGIAYDAENNRIFVTGKNWAKLFEIELIARK